MNTGLTTVDGTLHCRATTARCYTAGEAASLSASDALTTTYQCRACRLWHIDRVLLGVPTRPEPL